MQKKYLAQIYNIAPDYAEGVYKLLPKKEFGFEEVKELAEDAHVWLQGGEV